MLFDAWGSALNARKCEASDFPVLVPFSYDGDEFLLLSRASALDAAISGWERLPTRQLQEAIVEALRGKLALGPVEAPDDPNVAIGEFVAEGWYVTGRPQLVGWATGQFAIRYGEF